MSEVVIRVHLPVELRHLLTEVDAEVFDCHILALEESGQELPGEAVRVFLVETAELCPLRTRRQVFLALPLEHFFSRAVTNLN